MEIIDYFNDINKFMFESTNENCLSLSVDDLVLKCKEFADTNKYSKYFSALFYKTSKYVFKLCSNYKSIPASELISNMLTALDRAVKCFNNKCKFTSYYFNCYRWELNGQIYQRFLKKKRVQCYSLDDMELKEINIDKYLYSFDSDSNLIKNIETTNLLTEEEKLFMKLYITNYSYKEIRSIMEIPMSKYYKYKNKIKSIGIREFL